MKHFTMEELLWSHTANELGVDNTPCSQHRHNLVELCEEMLDPLREAWATHCTRHQLGSPALKVSSGYRGFRLNEAVGGARTSAHCVGLAADLVPLNGHLRAFKQFCRVWFQSHALDQMISEAESADGTPRWIHLGWKSQQGAQRHEMLSMRHGHYVPMTA